MKITLEFVGWLDERLYSRAVCGLLEKRAICPPLEAERNFEAKREGEREGERERVVRMSRSFLRNTTCSYEISPGWLSVPRQYLTDTPETRNVEANERRGGI